MDTWTTKDTQQLAKLIQTWARLMPGQPIDRRVFTSRRAIQWARHHDLLVEQGGRLVASAGWNAVFSEDLPVDVLWWFLSPAIPTQGSIGRSLATRPEWDALNLYCDPERRVHEQERVLLRLAAAGLIWFQSAGHIWNIERQRRAA